MVVGVIPCFRIDFAVLNTAVKHFLDRGYGVTIAATGISIYLSDYDAPFLKVHLPDEPPPAVDVDVDDEEQTDLSAFCSAKMVRKNIDGPIILPNFWCILVFFC